MKSGLTSSFNFAATFADHRGQRGLIEMIPTAWVVALANPQAGKTAPLLDGSTGDLDALWADMQAHGMRKPSSSPSISARQPITCA